MVNELLHPDQYRNPDQPPMVYDNSISFWENVRNGPDWRGQTPPLATLQDVRNRFLSKDLISPIAISAGPAYGKRWTDFFLEMGYGLVLQKTVRTTGTRSNVAPNVVVLQVDQQLNREHFNDTIVGTLDPKDVKTKKSISNSFGNPSEDPAVWSDELKLQVKSAKKGQMVGCSVTPTVSKENKQPFIIHFSNSVSEETLDTINDVTIAADKAAKTGADPIEENDACPNVQGNSVEGQLYQDAEYIKRAGAEFKHLHPNTKLGFKFGVYESKDQMQRVLAAAAPYYDYISGINAISMTVLGKDGSEILPGRKTSGTCGWFIQKIALEHIEWAAQIREEEGFQNLEILGGGGITEYADVDRFLEAGADQVQVATISYIDPLFAYGYRLYKAGLI